ncbi:hypothetical protein VTG60DRAFT_7100 [Thermothelomyces hinnuleus]
MVHAPFLRRLHYCHPVLRDLKRAFGSKDRGKSLGPSAVHLCWLPMSWEKNSETSFGKHVRSANTAALELPDWPTDWRKTHNVTCLFVRSQAATARLSYWIGYPSFLAAGIAEGRRTCDQLMFPSPMPMFEQRLLLQGGFRIAVSTPQIVGARAGQVPSI